MTTLRDCINAWHAAHPDFVREPLTVLTVRHEARWERAAHETGVPIKEYRRRMFAGDRWCSFCRDWHDAGTPFNGNTTVCKARWGDYCRALKARSA